MAQCFAVTASDYTVHNNTKTTATQILNPAAAQTQRRRRTVSETLSIKHGFSLNHSMLKVGFKEPAMGLLNFHFGYQIRFNLKQ